MRLILVLVAFCLSWVALAQDQGEFKKPPTKAVKVSTAPVTRAEARKVLDRAWMVLAKGLKLKGAAPFALVADATPVTKNEVLAEFVRVVALTAPSYKRNPRPSRFDAARLRKDGDADQITALVSKGLVMPLGPLVTGKNGTVSTVEFGDAIGVLMARLADLCHLPSGQYSPNLMPG